MKATDLIITAGAIATLFLLAKRAKARELAERYLPPPAPQEVAPEPGITWEPRPGLKVVLPADKLSELLEKIWPWKAEPQINFLPRG